MCFNISIVSTKAIIEKQFDAEFHINFSFASNRHISAFSNPEIPIIKSEQPKIIQSSYWGLIPHWVQDKKRAEEIRKMTYNAKIETIKQKPSFKDAYENRCLIIADGFYEWQHTSSGKICHFITKNEKNMLAFAGIHSTWINQVSGEVVSSTSILTQPANEMMAKIHNIKKRQPVVLSEDIQQQWLNKTVKIKDVLDSSYKHILKTKIVESPLKKAK